jgi:hypothetical protein
MDNFRTEFQKRLKESQYAFKEDSIAFVKANIETPCRYMFTVLCKKNSPFELDYKTIIKEINYLFEDPTNFNLQLRDSYSYMHPAFFNNEIEFRLPSDFPAGVYYTDRYWDFVNKNVDLGYDCEAEFWKKKDNNEWYEAIADFPCFCDIIIPLTEIEKYKEKGDIVNVEGWLKYLRGLLKLFFSDFPFSEERSTKRIMRFVKPLSDTLYFGFEYDESLLRRRYQNGYLEFPEYFNLILLNNDFKKTIKKEDYIFKYAENILSLGILGNPLFYVPSLSGFVAVDRVYERGNPQNMKFKYFRKYTAVNEKEVQIVHTDGVGERMKRHAFFYMDMLSYSSKNYLAFLEKNILSSVIDERF